jgi:hypothetical protein
MKSKSGLIIAVILILFSTIEAISQENIEVSGIVSCFNQIPLNNVKVAAVKSGAVTYTDSIGRFSLKCLDKDVLLFSAAGFENRKVKFGKDRTIVTDLMYKDNPANFNEAVSKRHIEEDVLRKSIEDYKLKNVKDFSKYNSIYELISSELYDVSVKGTSVYNKKIRSMDANPQVLYVVDEKITSDISYVNPTYVKSIEFIDDVGATMYGSKGANGVIKITLK